MVINNTDDIELLFGVTKLSDYLPFSRKGLILFITWNHEAVVRLDIPERNVIAIREIDRREALDLLRKGLKES